jgi:hypothetical protein
MYFLHPKLSYMAFQRTLESQRISNLTKFI